MEHKLISYVMILSFALAFILFLIIGFYTNFLDAFGIFVGMAWGCINFYFLEKLLQEWLKVDSRNPLKFYTIIGIKFPLLYLIGYGVLKMGLFPIVDLTLGFSLIFIAIFLLGLFSFTQERANIGSD